MLSFISFLEFGLTDILDICMVTLLLYALLRWLKGTAAIKIFIGVFLFYLLWRVFLLLHMDLLSEIIGTFLSVGVIALIVIFQPEIRKFFLFLGNNNFISNIKWLKTTSNNFSQLQVENLVKACKNMSASYTGALIIITKENTLEYCREFTTSLGLPFETLSTETDVYGRQDEHNEQKFSSSLHFSKVNRDSGRSTRGMYPCRSSS